MSASTPHTPRTDPHRDSRLPCPARPLADSINGTHRRSVSRSTATSMPGVRGRRKRSGDLQPYLYGRGFIRTLTAVPPATQGEQRGELGSVKLHGCSPWR